MKKPKLILPLAVLRMFVVIAVVAQLSISHNPVWAVIVLVADELWRWWGQKDRNLAVIYQNSLVWLSSFSTVIVISLTPNLVSQVVLVVMYGFWRWWLQYRFRQSGRSIMVTAAITQALVIWAVFLASAVWHWPTLLVLIIVWVASWLVGMRALAGANDRAARALALTWAMIVAECSWVFSLWLVNYVMFNGVLIVPQPVLVLSALGYCLAGIYSSHRQSQLTRKRLVEYLMIGLVVLVLVIAGTKWNGVI